jgi:Zn-finger nucleic acid-binding protein
MALTCPQCAAPMNEVGAEAKTGYMVMLDQCPRCGGIWCDRWELYPVTEAAAERIDAADKQALHQATPPADKQLECPRCRAHMFRFRDPTIPADARIERCPNCDGMWLNRGELRRFKEHAAPPAATTPEHPSYTPASEEELDRLTHRTLDPKSWPTVSTLGDAFDPSQEAVDADEVRDELKSGAFWLIARTVLRLLLHV